MGLLKKELEKINRQISDQANLIKAGASFQPTPH